MHRGVDFGTPRPGRVVGDPQIDTAPRDGGLGEQWDCQVALGVAAQVLHDALGFGIRSMTEVRRKPVMTCQSDVFGSGDHHVGDHPALEAGHSVSQYPGRHAADRVE